MSADLKKKNTCALARYDVRHLQRFELGTLYPTIAVKVADLMRADPLKNHANLIVDATGVGRPVVDLLTWARLAPIAITITGGDNVTEESKRCYRVPKRDLVSVLSVVLQVGRLRVARELPEADTLVNELLNFRAKINPITAHDSYAAWREGVHDDLVLAVAMAVWYAERCPPSNYKYTGIPRRSSGFGNKGSFGKTRGGIL